MNCAVLTVLVKNNRAPTFGLWATTQTFIVQYHRPVFFMGNLSMIESQYSYKSFFWSHLKYVIHKRWVFQVLVMLCKF